MSYADLKVDSGKFLKIETGRPADIHILTKSEEVVVRYNHGFGKEQLSCTGHDCNMCAEGEKRSQRFLINVYDRSDGKVKIFEFGPMIAGQIRDIAEMLKESGHTVHDIDLRIKKTVEGEKTSYMTMQKPMSSPIPEGLPLHKI